MNKLEKNKNNEFDELDLLNLDELINSSNNKKKKNIPRINDNENFNIINDIKINELQNKTNNSYENKKNKKKKSKELSPITNITLNPGCNTNNNELILDNNINLAALFGDDIEQNDTKKEDEENFEINMDIFNSIKKTDNNNNINNSESNKKENETNISSNIVDDFIDINFFDNLKDEESSNKKIKQNKNIDNEPKSIKELSNTELAEVIKKKQNNPDFKKQLKENGLDFTIAKDKNENNDNSEGNDGNVLTCAICFETTNNQNITMEALECGHFFCKNCIEKLPKKKKNRISCPLCKKEININKATTLYL